MDPTLTARLTPSHARRLAWFEDHQGEVTGIPEPLPDGLLLVSKPKGIYKPQDLPYAVSIRINLDSGERSGASEGLATAGIKWRVSSFCAVNGDCVAVAKLHTGEVALKDTKEHGGPVLRFDASEWRAFVARVRVGEFDA